MFRYLLLLLALSLAPAQAQAQETSQESGAPVPKPKYGSEAQVLSRANDYLRRAKAPDYWALSPYYLPQQNDRACSLASVTMLVNAARAGHSLTADDELATQTGLLARVKSDLWSKAIGNGGRGVTLDQLGGLVEQSLKVYGLEGATVEVVHTDDTSKATRQKLHHALVANEKSANDFIILNFVQGAYTGDANVGHIAPLAAYDGAKKRALVLDPDRQWYEPYWVSEATLLAGMATKDETAGKFRGYVWAKLARNAAKKK